VAAAVVFPLSWLHSGLPVPLHGLNDSKQLRSDQRDCYFAALTSRAEIQFAIACVDAGMVDQINILQASHRAMNDALDQLPDPPQHVLVDGTHVKSLRWPQTPIIKGDALSYSIAAASVLAKVTRDRLMAGYHDQWPLYGFAAHKGYATEQHLAALAAHGPCPIHRRSFSPLKPPEPRWF
jgi:ribonuclease HII